jgi:hypothetical protein
MMSQVMVRRRREALQVSWMLRFAMGGPREGWYEEAACRGGVATVEVCEQCPVRVDCGRDAASFEVADARFLWGVRGGFGPYERARMWAMRSDHCYTDGGLRL